MRSWAIAKAMTKQREIRRWKKRNLSQNTPVVSPHRQPVFKAGTNSQEVGEFLNRMRDRH